MPDMVCAWRSGCVVSCSHRRVPTLRESPMFRDVLSASRALRFAEALESRGIDTSRLVGAARNGERSLVYMREPSFGQRRSARRGRLKGLATIAALAGSPQHASRMRKERRTDPDHARDSEHLRSLVESLTEKRDRANEAMRALNDALATINSKLDEPDRNVEIESSEISELAESVKTANATIATFGADSQEEHAARSYEAGTEVVRRMLEEMDATKGQASLSVGLLIGRCNTIIETATQELKTGPITRAWPIQLALAYLAGEDVSKKYEQALKEAEALVAQNEQQVRENVRAAAEAGGKLDEIRILVQQAEVSARAAQVAHKDSFYEDSLDAEITRVETIQRNVATLKGQLSATDLASQAGELQRRLQSTFSQLEQAKIEVQARREVAEKEHAPTKQLVQNAQELSNIPQNIADADGAITAATGIQQEIGSAATDSRYPHEFKMPRRQQSQRRSVTQLRSFHSSTIGDDSSAEQPMEADTARRKSAADALQKRLQAHEQHAMFV